MSQVTTVVIMCDEPIDDAPIAGLRKLHYSDDFGGGKCAETDVYTAAVNHLDWQAISDWIDERQWKHPECVMVCLSSWDCGAHQVWRPLGHET